MSKFVIAILLRLRDEKYGGSKNNIEGILSG